MKALTRTLALLGCAAALGAALAACDQELGNNDERAEIVGEITYPAGEKIANRMMPAMSVSAEKGFTVEFKATLPTDTNSWGAHVLSYKGFYVTIPNLDPYNNTAGDKELAGKNAFPAPDVAGVRLADGKFADSAFDDDAPHTVKIKFTKDTIMYYLDGDEWVQYSSSVWDGLIERFIGYFVEGFNAGEVVFNDNSYDLTDLKITKNTIVKPQPAPKTDGYYELKYDDKFTTTIAGQKAIDAYKFQSKMTHDANPPIWWESPLYGMKADELKDGITIQADVYTPGLSTDKSGGYDALLTFYKPGESWEAVSIDEGGVLRINSGTIGGWYENLNDATKGKWVTVTIVFSGDSGFIKYYVDGTNKNAVLNNLDDTSVSYANIVNYFTTVASHVAVGVGFAENGGAKASYVDNGCGIKNIRIYPKAITIGSEG
ncbi:MAG: hypothetical protein J1D88_09195 [Treponema sp.]|nr:hypothetical protein [Treponema sp.]